MADDNKVWVQELVVYGWDIYSIVDQAAKLWEEFHGFALLRAS